MATLTAYNQLTLMELARRQDPKGETPVIAEILTKTNEILKDAVWRPANSPFAHKSVQRASLPTGQWRKFNAGISPSASQTKAIVDVMGQLEDYLRVDAQLAKAHPGGERAYRQEEAVAFLEGMSQTLASTIIYGNVATDPEKFHGLAPRMSSLASNVVSCSGTGSDLTSVYVVQWGVNTVHMIYPPYDKTMGIQHRDLGETTYVDPSDGTMYQVFLDHFRITCGLVVKDPRAIARVANIESSGTSNIFDEDKLIQVLNNMPNSGRGAVIYVNPTVRTQMEIALKDKTNVNFTAAKGEGLAGEPVLYFRGNPVRTVEAILNTESAIS